MQEISKVKEGKDFNIFIKKKYLCNNICFFVEFDANTIVLLALSFLFIVIMDSSFIILSSLL